MSSQGTSRNLRSSLGNRIILIAVMVLVTTSLTVSARMHVVAASPSPGVDASKLPGGSNARIEGAYGKLPLSFEANRGQTDGRVKFLSRGSGYTFFLAEDEVVMVLRRAPIVKNAGPDHRVAEELPPREQPARRTVLRMRMVGANPNPAIAGLDTLAGKSNYFIGNDPAKWRRDVPHFEKVRYEGVYKGIDLVFHGNQRQLEYDFVVTPGADPGAIRLAWKGAKRVEVDGRGDLILHVEGGRVVHWAPVVYQKIGGARREIRGSYVLRGKDQVGFRVAAYDPARPLVIDPVLVYSTYLGGTAGGGVNPETGRSIAIDGGGNAYVVGYTNSTDFPTVNPFQATNAGSLDMYVSKLNPSGSALVYSTYIGGAAPLPAPNDFGNGIAVDNFGNAYVVGNSYSTDFPRVNPIQTCSCCDAVVLKLNASGSGLYYSTCLGGSNGTTFGTGIAVDSLGNAYVTGRTFSTNFPRVNAIQFFNAGGWDVFVSKLNASGSALVYSTYLGGTAFENGPSRIALDGARNVYVTGLTSSTNFPTVNPIQAANAGGAYDAFVAKINAAGSALIYSTYLGGSGDDSSLGLAVDGSGNAYVSGSTTSTNFPTANPLQASYNSGTSDGFVAKINAAGSALTYSTYLGGSGTDRCEGIAVDGSGNAYVTGPTSSINFLTANPLQANLAGGAQDAFVSKINAAGSALSYSTYLGGSGSDSGVGIAVDGPGNAYVTGSTSSTNFPTVSPLQTANAGSTDAFVAKIGINEPAPGMPTLGSTGAGLLVLGLLAAARKVLRRRVDTS